MLELDALAKTYTLPDGSSVEAIRHISLTIEEREFFTFVGPSGCGKTTLLKLITGLEKPTGGKIILNDEVVRSIGRDRGMVFQHFTSFPWLTVSENIAFGLRLHRAGERKIQKVVSHYLKLTGLEQFKDSYPNTLSGGMRQRVAIARTFANNPKILLLDEPFGALDVQTRSQMQEFLEDIWEQEKKTVILVTHDIEEAIFLADRVLLMTSRPSKIKREFLVTFPRPRRHSLKFTTQFFKLKKEIASLL